MEVCYHIQLCCFTVAVYSNDTKQALQVLKLSVSFWLVFSRGGYFVFHHAPSPRKERAAHFVCLLRDGARCGATITFMVVAKHPG